MSARRVVGLATAVVSFAAIAVVALASGVETSGYGLSLRLPPGWVGQVLPGEITAIAPSGAVLQLDEAVVSPQKYTHLPRHIRAGTTRLFVRSGGRQFFLYVHTTSANLAATNTVLASIRIRPWSAPLAAPHFRSAPGWQAGHSGPAPVARADVSAWASTAPYANSPVDLPPEATLAHTGASGVVVWVGLVRPRTSRPFLTRKDPLDLRHALCTRAWEGAIPGVIQCTLWSHVPGRFEISIYVYMRRQDRLPAAQAELRRLVLPNWP